MKQNEVNSLRPFIDSRTFEWALTLTFPGEIKPDKAQRACQYYFFRLRSALCDRNKQKTELVWLASPEEEEESSHLHAIASGTGLNNLDRNSWQVKWGKQTGGFATIRLVHDQSGWFEYCLKGSGDWFCSDNFLKQDS